MRSEPLQRNFGVASPNKKIDTDPKRPNTSGSRGGRLREMPVLGKRTEEYDFLPFDSRRDEVQPIGSNDQTVYDHLTTEEPKTKKE